MEDHGRSAANTGGAPCLFPSFGPTAGCRKATTQLPGTRSLSASAAYRGAAVLSGLLAWRDAARAKGLAGLIVLDGSFISRKDAPGDFDCIFVYNTSSSQTVSQDREALALLDNAHCKERYSGDVWAFSEEAVREFPAFCRIDGFDLHKMTRQPKGVVEVDL